MAQTPSSPIGEFTLIFGRDGVVQLHLPDDYTLADLPMLKAVTAAVAASTRGVRVLPR